MSQEPELPIPQAGAVAPTRVLIADDDVTMCTFCARALSAAGHSSATALTAEARCLA
jgi:hypothetical protein